MEERTKKGSRLLSVLLSAAIMLSAAGAVLGGIRLFARASETITIPYHDFTGMEELNPTFLGNSNDKKERWCSGANGDATLELADASYLSGGKSAKMTNPKAGGLNGVFVDLYDSNALAAGDYTLFAYIKLEDVVTDSANAGDQGFRLMVNCWKTDDSGINWEQQGFDFRGPGYKGTSDWQKVKMDFSVPEGVKTVRIQGNFSNCKGTAYVTNFIITEKGAPEPADPAKPKDPIPYHDFTGMEDLNPIFLGNSNDKKERWCSGATDDATLELADASYLAGGKSAKMTNPKAGGLNGVFVDLYDSNALAAGDYTLFAYIKLEDVVTDRADAGDQGFRLMVNCWKTDDSGINWEQQGFDYRSNGYKTTTGWQKVKMDFSVPEGVKTVRIQGNFSNCKGTAYVTNFIITEKGAPEPEEPLKKDPIPYHDFTGMEDLNPTFLANSMDKKDRWCTWSNESDNDESAGKVYSELSDISNVEGGKSLKMVTGETGLVNRVFVDLYDSNALEPGDYTLSAYIKLENTTLENPGATDQGFRLNVVNWNTEDNDVEWDRSGKDFKGNGFYGTLDWKKISLDFTVLPGVKTVRIMGSFSNCKGVAYVTDFEIASRGGQGGEVVGLPDIANPSFEEEMEIIPNNTPAGAEGDAIRYQWGAWHGSSTDGSPVDQTIADAFQIVKEGTPEGFTAALKINAKKGTSYELRQIVEGLDPDVEYVLRAQVKTEALDGLGASVRAAFLTADKEMIWEVEGASLESKIINGDSGWADLYVKFNMPEGARDLFLAASVKDAGGAAYFTNFELLPAVFYEEPGDDDNSSNPSNPSDGSTPSDGSNPTDDSSDTQGSSEEPEIPETGDRPAVLAILGIAVSAAAVLTAKKRRKA